MAPETAKLTIRLPRREIEFAKSYAKEHGISVTALIDRYLRHMRELSGHSPAPELDAITGLLPSDVDARELYREDQLKKHGR